MRTPSAMLLVGTYSLAIGIMMFVSWAMLLLTGQVPEVRTTPRELAFHLPVEFASAILLVGAGVGLVLGRGWTRFLTPIAFGMLLYTVVNSAGFYAQRVDLAMVTMFLILLILTVLAIIGLFWKRGVSAPRSQARGTARI